MPWDPSLAKGRTVWHRAGPVLFTLAVGATLSLGARQVVGRLDRHLLLESCRRHDARACARLCGAGDVPSCFHLGEAFQEGRGAPVDRERSIALFDLACRGWDRRGCRELGLAYRAGAGRRRDARRARELLRLACDGQEGRACTVLGEMVATGEGGQKDLARAERLFERGCAAYDAEGCARAGALLVRAGGSRQRSAQALPLLERGCREGVALGCAVLAQGHAEGWNVLGGKSDMKRARHFERRACDRGDGSACRALLDHDAGS